MLSYMGLVDGRARGEMKDLVVQMKHRFLQIEGNWLNRFARAREQRRLNGKLRAEGLSACSPRSKRRVDSRRGMRIA